LSAAIFRVFFLNLSEFKIDEARIFDQIISFYENPALVQRGIPSSLGTYNFPLFSYFMIVLGFFSKNPLTLNFLIALINASLVPVFFITSRRFFSRNVAIIASLFIAFSPWAILFSRKIWAQDLIFLLLVPLFYSLNSFFIRRKTEDIFWVFLLLTLLAQLHGSGIFLALSVIITILILRRKVSYYRISLGIITGLISAIPFLIFQLTSNPICPDCIALLNYQSSLKFFDASAFIRPFQALNMLGFGFVLGFDYLEFVKFFPIQILRYFFAISMLIFVAGVLRIIKGEREHLYLLLLVLIIPFLYFLTRTKAYMHYYIILLPFIAIIYASGVEFLYKFSKNYFFKAFIISVLLFFLGTNILFEITFNQFLLHKKLIEGDYGAIFSQTEEWVRNETEQYSRRNDYSKIRSIGYVSLIPPLIHKNLGKYFMEQGNFEDAISEYEKALILLDQRDDEVKQNLISLYYKTGRAEKAEKVEKSQL